MKNVLNAISDKFFEIPKTGAGTSFAILNSISQNFDPALQSVIMIVSAALTIYFVLL